MLLEAKGVSRFFQSGRIRIAALLDVSLKCDKGEFLVITGPSGSGKSTLLHILSSLDLPNKGEVRYEGKSLSSLSTSQLAWLRNTSFGFVFQTPHLLPHRTVLENVALPFRYGPRKSREYIRSACMRMLEYVGMADFSNRLPGSLSGGEMQRVVFARALVHEPNIIFADEPTGSLDGDNAHRLLNLLEEQTTRGRTVIMATHDPAAIGRGTYEIQLKKGVACKS
ncbi:ABC transporter ATP-binding protein [Candidatus Parcubacteria bacterium]|nr:MAG: ABC transporter ATP-binding protein [Candidatus Parcubacteria bacterium]